MANSKRKNSSLKINLKTTKHFVFDNTSENVIQINESKARLLYQNHIKNTPNLNLFFTYLGLFASFLISILTTTFNDIFNIQGSGLFIECIFIIGSIATLMASIYVLVKWFINKKRYNEDKFIKDLKSDNE